MGRILVISIVLIALLLCVFFSEEILTWSKNVLIEALIYLAVFIAGWLIGRYGRCSKA